MGIIGVVAALTIPNVNKNTCRAESVAKLKKIHAELNEAHSRATAVYGPFEKWFVNDDCTKNVDCAAAKIRYFNRITEFMKITKNCGTTENGCMRTSAKYLYYNTSYGWNLSSPSALLAGGWSFNVNIIYSKNTGSSFNGYNTNNSSVGQIYVDIDGPNKGKNTHGIDIFRFNVTTNGIYPGGGGSYWSDDNLKAYCFYYGYACAEWVIRNGNMDYLNTVKATSNSNSGVCKNGKQLSTTVSSCK